MRHETELESIGNAELSAWCVSESCCRIQTTSPQIAKLLKRLPDCEQAGYGVAGRFLRVFSIRRTLPWVKREVIEKHCLFSKKNEGSSRKNALPSDFIAGTGQHSGALVGRA
jgi:hypothetical protein